MIPKVIHYCWFGQKPLPKSALSCINSWKLFFPDYQIKEWNENNFDLSSVPYVSEAYNAKKYAFVSDYVRFWIMYNYGGVYFDVDVQIIKSMDDIIAKGPFMGCENDGGDNNRISVNPGLGIGANPCLKVFKEILDKYSNLHFINSDGSYNQTTIVAYTTDILLSYKLKNISEIQQCAGIYIYPKEYFCPLNYETRIMNITANTRSIHLYSASWVTKKQMLYKKVSKMFGVKFAQYLSKKIKRMLYLKCFYY